MIVTGASHAAACNLRRVRAEALPKLKGGLRALYRTLELPGANPLKPALPFLGRSRGDETLTSSAREKLETPHVVSYGEITRIVAVASGGDPFPWRQFPESSRRRKEAPASSEASGKKSEPRHLGGYDGKG